MVTIVIITLINNFLIEILSAEIEFAFLPIIILASALYCLDYFEIINFTKFLSSGIIVIPQSSILIIIPIAILVVLYLINFKILRKKLFLDSSLKTKVEVVKMFAMEWTKNFGDIAPFMQLDLKLIWRNKRSKSTLWMLGLGLFYGLIFYPNPIYADKPVFLYL